MYRLRTDTAQVVYRYGTGCVQMRHRLRTDTAQVVYIYGTGYVQVMYSWGTGYVQMRFRLCTGMVHIWYRWGVTDEVQMRYRWGAGCVQVFYVYKRHLIRCAIFCWYWMSSDMELLVLNDRRCYITVLYTPRGCMYYHIIPLSMSGRGEEQEDEYCQFGCSVQKRLVIFCSLFPVPQIGIRLTNRIAARLPSTLTYCANYPQVMYRPCTSLVQVILRSYTDHCGRIMLRLCTDVMQHKFIFQKQELNSFHSDTWFTGVETRFSKT